MEYRKRPVAVEAFQRMKGSEQKEDSVRIVRTTENGVMWFGNAGALDVKLMIWMLGGIHEASVGDYTIRGIVGEIYPCKSGIFFATYEPTAMRVPMNVTTHLDGDEIKYETDGL